MILMICMILLVSASAYLAYKSIHSQKALMVILSALYLGLTPAILFFCDQIAIFFLCVAIGLLLGTIYNTIDHKVAIQEYLH